MFEFITQEYFERCHDMLSENYPIRENNTYVSDDGESLIAYYEPPEKYTLPKKIALDFDSELLKHRHREYIETFMSECIYPYIDYETFGNIMKWTFLTEFKESSLLCEQCVGLIIKCEYPYPVGYIYSTDCQDLYVGILYETFEEYLQEFESWEKMQKENNLAEINELYNVSRNDDKLKNHTYIANSMPTFTEYILTMKDKLCLEIEFNDESIN